MTKLTNYEKHFQEKMKDKAFATGFARDRHRLEIAYNIIELRKSKRMSQAVLARKIDTTQSVIARIESGHQNISADKLQKIASACDKQLEVKFV